MYEREFDYHRFNNEYVQCEYGELIFYFDREYSTREWNLKLIREKGID